MIGFAVTVLIIFAAGFAVSERLWREEPAGGGCERFLNAAVMGTTLWVGANWILALTHTLTQVTLLVVLVLLAVLAVVLRPRIPLRLPRVSLLVLPIAAWTLFALWKGAVLPPQTHDVLSYHLPKAVMMMRAHGFEHFAASDPRITNYPANYELMLTDILVLSGSDRLTEWINTLAYLLFLCAGAAFAERWWPSPHRAAVALVIGSAPVLLLHSAADKNDVMACLFGATALLWGARWIARGGRMPMLLLIVSLALAGGTKPGAAPIAVGLAPFLLTRLRGLRARDVALTALATVLAFALLGGAPYVDNALRAGAPIGMNVAGVKAGSGASIEWGDFANLWRVPVMMLLVPFVPDERSAWVPWRHEYWYWPHYEIYFSHYGALISFLVILLPLCVIRYRQVGDALIRRERRDASLAAAIAVALILPIKMAPLGMFAALPRYIAFILPIIIAWTIPPLAEELKTRSPSLVRVAAATLAGVFAFMAVDNAVNDHFAPYDFAVGAAEHPGTRRINNRLRAGSMVDRLAGPHDTVGVDGEFDTWSYPAYGTGWTRDVVFLPQGMRPDQIPPSVQWVVIDRSWNRIWGSPKLTDMGKYWYNIGRGTPKPEDVQLLRALLGDPHWKLVFVDLPANNALFRRVR